MFQKPVLIAIKQIITLLRIHVQAVIQMILTRQLILIILQRYCLKHAKPAIRRVPGFHQHSITLRYTHSPAHTQRLLVSRVTPPDTSILRIPVPVAIPMITTKPQIPTILLRCFRKPARPAIRQVPGFHPHLTILRFTL